MNPVAGKMLTRSWFKLTDMPLFMMYT